MKRLACAALVGILTIGCEGSTPSSPSAAPSNTSTPNASIAAPTSTLTSSGPRTSFGNDAYHVGSDLAPGRYYTQAATTSCYWERVSGFGGTVGEIIANDFIDFTAPQIVVDVAASDQGFTTGIECGTWSQEPKAAPAAGTVPGGWWMVNAQIQPGTYSTTASSGCYWERLRNFGGTISGIVDNDFESGAGQLIVQIGSTDIGFHSEPECGTWRPVSGSSAPAPKAAQSRFDIEANLALHRAATGR
jgi:hypothetical protein